MNQNPTSDTTKLEIFVTFAKKKDSLTFTHNKEVYKVSLDGTKIDIIKLDEIITKIIVKEGQLRKIRQELMGDSAIIGA